MHAHFKRTCLSYLDAAYTSNVFLYELSIVTVRLDVKQVLQATYITILFRNYKSSTTGWFPMLVGMVLKGVANIHKFLKASLFPSRLPSL